MVSFLDQSISMFMQDHWDGQNRLLLAFSGGPDSLALLHLLVDYFTDQGLNPGDFLALAHVDHGWRVESAEERGRVAQMASALGLRLHIKILDPKNYVGNLEEACRKERLRFFAKLSVEEGYRAVFLAQHADDQAETVLKRVLEGAALINMGSMRLVTEIEGINLWRPLLFATKQQLVDLLAARHLVGFDDYTNNDQRFLRAKLRATILPELSRAFGKEVSANLVNLGLEAAELQDYLETKMAPFLAQAQQGPFGTWLDFNKLPVSFPLEVRFLVRKCCGLENIFLSRASIRVAGELLVNRQPNKQLSAGKNTVIIDRGHLFVLSKKQELLPEHRHLLLPGLQRFGSWSVQVTYHEMSNGQLKSTSWHHLWAGKAEAILPMGQYYVAAPQDQATFSKMWTNEKVPAFLRKRVPIIYSGNNVTHEFLSGRQVKRPSEKEIPCVKIEMWRGG